METIIASRRGMCVCARVCESLSLARSLAVVDCCCDVWRIKRSFARCVYFARFLVFREVRLFVCEWGSAEENFAGESVYPGQLRKLIQTSKWPNTRSPTVVVGLVRQLLLFLCLDSL